MKQNIESKYNTSEFVDLCGDLLKDIENQFKELFVEINFCFGFGEKDKYTTNCILCNKEVKTEGGYHKHVGENIHKINKLNYEKNERDDKALFKNEELSLYDFIQTVKQQYYNKNNYLLNLINDYQLFKLLHYKESYIKIGSFTACSNITGLLLDIEAIAFLMHSYNGFPFFDIATGSPYLQRLKMDIYLMTIEIY